MDRFDELRKLRKNWDSYDGDPPTQAAIEATESIYRNLSFVPISDGSIQLEFHAAGADVEVVVSPDGKVVYVGFETR